MNEWQSDEHASAYLKRADQVPHRSIGEAVLLDEIPRGVCRVLDLGSGDGRLLEVVLRERPHAKGIALDFSPHMLHQLRTRFGPMSRAEMRALGWDSCDVILVTGDAYIDHPSFGMALVGRLLEAEMLHESKSPEIFRSDEERMFHAPTHPQTRVDVARVDYCARETHARHDREAAR